MNYAYRQIFYNCFPETNQWTNSWLSAMLIVFDQLLGAKQCQ